MLFINHRHMMIAAITDQGYDFHDIVRHFYGDDRVRHHVLCCLAAVTLDIACGFGKSLISSEITTSENIDQGDDTQ